MFKVLLQTGGREFYRLAWSCSTDKLNTEACEYIEPTSVAILHLCIQPAGSVGLVCNAEAGLGLTLRCTYEHVKQSLLIDSSDMGLKFLFNPH